MSRPIRLGLIGLSANGSWASGAHLPYLQSASGQRHYTIRAVCNSSTASSEAAIRAYSLDTSVVKPYGSAADLAADPDIDMIVVCVKAPAHVAAARPAIAAGKKIFMEYPIASNVEDSTALLAEARSAGLKDKDLVCGLEEAWDACAKRVRQLVVDEGKIGQVVQVMVDLAGAPLAGRVAQRHEYALKNESGAAINLISHLLNAVTTTLGPLATHRCLELNLRPDVEIVDDAELRKPGTGSVLRKVVKEVADHTVVLGQFADPIPSPTSSSSSSTLSSPSSSPSGPALIGTVRSDKLWPSEPMLSWRIVGTRGQVRIQAPTGLALEFDDNTTIEHLDYESGVVSNVPWKGHEVNPYDEVEKEMASLPGPARIMGRTYEAFARGEHVKHAGWETAVKWQGWVDDVLKTGV